MFSSPAGKILFRRSHIRDVAVKRLIPIDEYCKVSRDANTIFPRGCSVLFSFLGAKCSLEGRRQNRTKHTNLHSPLPSPYNYGINLNPLSVAHSVALGMNVPVSIQSVIAGAASLSPLGCSSRRPACCCCWMGLVRKEACHHSC